VTDSAADGALGLYSAAADALAGRRLGFGQRRAALAARFARQRGADDAATAANWLAGALGEIGLIEVALEPDAGAHARDGALSAAPWYGARIVATLPGGAGRAADIVRWHREHDDGTGVPDRLRWDGIPTDAAALGIVHAFVEAVERSGEGTEAGEALFEIIAESGRKFRVELVRAFRAFIGVDLAGWDQPHDAALPPTDDDALLAGLVTRLDLREGRGAGLSERIASLAAAVAGRLERDAPRAARLARLLALGAATPSATRDDFDPLSRFARDARASNADRAAAIASAVPRYAGDAPVLAASARWHEDGHDDPLAAVLAVALAVTALPAGDAPRRIAAAAGTQFDPVVTRAYLAEAGAAR
jgi:hypothetical protein